MRIIPSDYAALASDISVIISFISLAISIFLFFEARKIYKQFMGKARIPELTKDLEDKYREISDKISNFQENKKDIFIKSMQVKSLVKNLEAKLTNKLEKRSCKDFISHFEESIFFTKKNKAEFTENECWSMLTDLSALVTTLKEFEKDSIWS